MNPWCWRCSCDKDHKHHHHQNHRIIALHRWSYNGVNTSKTSIFQLHFTFTSSASVSVLTTSYTTMSAYHVYLSTCPFPLAAIPLLHKHPTLITVINRLIPVFPISTAVTFIIVTTNITTTIAEQQPTTSPLCSHGPRRHYHYAPPHQYHQFCCRSVQHRHYCPDKHHHYHRYYRSRPPREATPVLCH